MAISIDGRPSVAGLYIHVPFCASRCIYCGFYSTTRLALRDAYVDALCGEMDLLAWRPRISTVYLGGGTPSQLTHAQLRRLFHHIYNRYSVSEDAEVTLECNPDDVRRGMLDGLPVNRVSMGAQTFADRRLRLLRRRHTAREVDDAVRSLRADGIGNVSLDLMFGFPGETLADWVADIRHAIALHPEHVSAYGLMYEEGTPLHRMLERGEVKETDEELSLVMYDRLVDTLTEAGYEHYEISNFARLDAHGASRSPWRSRHNSSYWNDTPYIGIGAAAHSYDRRTRHWNPRSVERYIASIRAGELPYDEETIDSHTHYDDLITTALRTREGLDLSMLDDAHRRYLMAAADGYLGRGLLALDGGRLRLTRPGIALSNLIMSDLMDVE